MTTTHRESPPRWTLLGGILLLLSCSSSALGPRCAEYLGETGCCLKAAAGNPAAVNACQELATQYASAASREQAEASCRQAQETAIAAHLCSETGAPEPSPACVRYLNCVAKAAPAVFPAELGFYGPKSSCWTSAAMAPTCTAACLSALDTQRQASPSVPECAVCATSADCWSARPICDPASKTCVVCTKDAECFTGFCNDARCMPGCRIGGAYVASQAVNPQNPCQSCQPARATMQWSDLPAGTECAAGSVCVGSCQPGCYIDGVFRTPGTLDPNSACRRCDPALQTARWSNVDDGTSCFGGMVCLNGLCGGPKIAP